MVVGWMLQGSTLGLAARSALSTLGG